MELIRVCAYNRLNVAQQKLRFNLRASKYSSGVYWHPYPNSFSVRAYK